MKLITETAPVERGVADDGTEQTFRIRASAKAFSILSDKLYSNKPRAIIRELACNAYDSHVAAGKSDTPIEIRLPTALDPTFYVKDFGLGLSHEQVMNLYTTYFESTKAGSDDFIGQLGLGSKSPFSYTSTFIVEAAFDGSLRTYSCFKNEEGLPSIVLLNEQPTDQGNGVTVSVAIEPSDVGAFVSEAEYVLQYFNPQPTIVGGARFHCDPVEHVLQGADWKMRKRASWAGDSGAQIVQGFVPYPISRDHLSSDGSLDAKVLTALSLDIDITVPIGTVDIAPSREALSYDKKTIRNLITALSRIGDDVAHKVSEMITDAPNLWSAHIRANQMSTDQTYGHLVRKMIQTGLLEWNGTVVKQGIRVEVPDTPSKMQVFRVKAASWNRTLPRVEGYGGYDDGFSITPTDNVRVMVAYTDNMPLHRIKYYMDEHPGVVIYIVRPTLMTSSQAQMRTDAQSVVEAFHYPHQVTYIADLPARPRTSTNTTKTVKRLMSHKLHFVDYERADFTRWDNFSAKTWVSKECDMNTSQVYVVLKRFTPTFTGKETLSERNVKDLFWALPSIQRLTGDDTEVIGLSEKEYEALSVTQRATWVPLTDHIASTLAKWISSSVAANCLLAHDAYGKVSSDWYGLSSLTNDWPKYKPLMEEGKCKDLITQVADIFSKGGDFKTGDVDLVHDLITRVIPARYNLTMPTVSSAITFPPPGTWIHRVLTHYVRDATERIGLINAFTLVERLGPQAVVSPTHLLMQTM